MGNTRCFRTEHSIIAKSGNTEEKLLIMVNAIIIAPVLEEYILEKCFTEKQSFI